MKLVRIIFFIIIPFCINLNVYAGPTFESNFDITNENKTATGVEFNPSGGIASTWHNENANKAGNVLISANKSIHKKMLRLLKPALK